MDGLVSWTFPTITYIRKGTFKIKHNETKLYILLIYNKIQKRIEIGCQWLRIRKLRDDRVLILALNCWLVLMPVDQTVGKKIIFLLDGGGSTANLNSKINYKIL
jgi:hypothetical protein